jgi:hypothetical protein
MTNCTCHLLNFTKNNEQATKYIQESLTFRGLLASSGHKTDPKLFECESCNRVFFVDIEDERHEETGDFKEKSWETEREKVLQLLALGRTARLFGIKGQSGIGYVTYFHQWYTYEKEAKMKFHTYVKDKKEFDRALKKELMKLNIA